MSQTNASGKIEDSALIRMVLEGNHEKVSLLLDGGEDPNSCYNNDFNAVHYAVMGFVECRDRGIVGVSGDDFLRVLRVLLQRGADPNSKSKDGHTPLQLAIDLDWPDGAYELFAKGATIPT